MFIPNNMIKINIRMKPSGNRCFAPFLSYIFPAIGDIRQEIIVAGNKVIEA